MVYFPAVHSFPTPTPHPSPLSYVFPLSPPSRRLPGSKERLHTHIHPTMPLRVIRMSLFTSWSVQDVGKQIQSLPDYVSRSPTLTSIHLLSVWNAQGSNAFAVNIATIIYCTYNAFKIFGVNFKDKFKIIENNLIVFMHLAVLRITSFGIEESFLALITFIDSYIGCVCVWWLLAVTRLSFPCVSNQSIGLFAPPSNFDVTIDCSHLPLNSKVRGAELHFWIALTFALHMLSGFTEPRAKQTWCSQARGCVTARQRCDVFFFPFNSPTEDDVYVIDFSPTSLSNMFPLQCAKQDWVQAWSMHCFSFSITLEWAEDTKGYTGEVWQGMEAKQRFWRPPQGRCMSLPGMFVCACVHVCGGEKRSERKTNMQREVEQIHVFLTTSSSGLTSLSSCLLCASCLFFTGNHFPCLYVTLALPSHIKLQVLHKCLSSHLPLDNLQEDYSSFLCLPHKWFSETHTKAICSTTWAVGHRSRKRRLHIRHEDQSFKTHSGVSAL